jgi:hypothetical protein
MNASETEIALIPFEFDRSISSSEKRMLAIQRTNMRGRSIARSLLALCLSIAIIPIAIVFAGEPAKVEGSSSRDSREQALRAIPMGNLTPQAIAKLKPVLDDPTIFRRMPVQSIVCDPEMFSFIVRHPEVLVEIWQVMGMTRVNIGRTGPFTFAGEDGAGTTCRCELVLGSETIHIYYTEGDYEGGLINRKLDGRCICIIHSQSTVSESGQPLVTANMDIFLKLDNIGADLIAKTISPLVVKTADYNYIESLRFVSQLSSAAQRNPQAVEQLATRLEGLRPEVRNRFVQVSHQSAIRRDRLISARSQQMIEENAISSTAIGKATPTQVPPAGPPSNATSSESLSFGDAPAANVIR